MHMEPWELPPGEKPLFCDEERLAAHMEKLAEAAEQAPATFDNELQDLPDLRDDMPARGKGPSRGYVDRWRLIALYKVYGYTNGQIARHLGYSDAGISLALQHEFVQTEMTRLRSEFVTPDALETLKRATSSAALRLERAIIDPHSKEGHDAAKYVLDKVTGKARQEVQHESGTLLNFMELVRDLNKRTGSNLPLPAAGDRTIDVTPGASGPLQPLDAEPRSKFDAWLDANLA